LAAWRICAACFAAERHLGMEISVVKTSKTRRMAKSVTFRYGGGIWNGRIVAREPRAATTPRGCNAGGNAAAAKMRNVSASMTLLAASGGNRRRVASNGAQASEVALGAASASRYRSKSFCHRIVWRQSASFVSMLARQHMARKWRRRRGVKTLCSREARQSARQHARCHIAIALRHQAVASNAAARSGMADNAYNG
jgi:hypothetical protein